jgi:hypothetical protein
MSAHPPSPRKQRLKHGWPWVAVIVAGLALAMVGALLWRSSGKSLDEPKTRPLALFNEADLAQTVVVPTLDTPLPAGKSAIWCASFQIAWNRLQTEVVKAPLHVVGAEELAARLNRAKSSESDLEPGSFYAAAGWIKDGILDRIREDMRTQFPGVTLPDFGPDDPRRLAVAFAFLQEEVHFRFEYIVNKEPLVFTDSAGKQTRVRCFGIPADKKEKGVFTYRSQVKILLQQGDDFALDLSRDTSPNQVVVARIGRHETLAAMLKWLRDQKARAAANKHEVDFTDADTLLVPEMAWLVRWRFAELEQKELPTPPGGFLAKAWQEIGFRLDRKGARVQSKGVVNDWLDGNTPHPYHCDRPFLVYLKKRGAELPFLVVWVDNAELLQGF